MSTACGSAMDAPPLGMATWSLYPDAGCHCSRPRPSGGNRLLMVVIIRAELRYFRDWVLYHHMLGIDEFVIISNECDKNYHENIVGSLEHIPCAPRFTFVDGFRCASSFQTSAYRASVKALAARDDLDPLRTRLLFSDVDEYLVVRGVTADRSPIDALFAAGAANASMWTVWMRLASPRDSLPRSPPFRLSHSWRSACACGGRCRRRSSARRTESSRQWALCPQTFLWRRRGSATTATTPSGSS